MKKVVLIMMLLVAATANAQIVSNHMMPRYGSISSMEPEYDEYTKHCWELAIEKYVDGLRDKGVDVRRITYDQVKEIDSLRRYNCYGENAKDEFYTMPKDEFIILMLVECQKKYTLYAWNGYNRPTTKIAELEGRKIIVPEGRYEVDGRVKRVYLNMVHGDVVMINRTNIICYDQKKNELKKKKKALHAMMDELYIENENSHNIHKP